MSFFLRGHAAFQSSFTFKETPEACVVTRNSRDLAFFGEATQYAPIQKFGTGVHLKALLVRRQSLLYTPVFISPIADALCSSLILSSKMSVQNGEAVRESAISTRPLVIAVPNIRVRVQIGDRVMSILAHVLPCTPGLDPSLCQQ